MMLTDSAKPVSVLSLHGAFFLFFRSKC
uniref:Uncharacterized protein n=1 Tax=Rhizophora mucronata TaxID=61149 RepID=A0A2P2QNI1_RHIMU